MKKIIKYLCVLLVAFCTLTGCNKDEYKDEAGKYEIVSITYNGEDVFSQFEYYYIELKENGDCIIASKGVGQSTTYEAEATFEIEDEKIFVYSKVNGIKVTEEYDYIDGKIIMNYQNGGLSIYAVFERPTEDK